MKFVNSLPVYRGANGENLTQSAFMRAKRAEVGLSQQKYADRLNVSIQAIQAIEQGRTAISPHMRAVLLADDDTLELTENGFKTSTSTFVPLRYGLRAIRHRLGMTREQFARELNAAAVTVGNWERGQNVPLYVTVENIKKLWEKSCF